MGDAERRAKQRIHWDGTITAGNLLTASAMVLALVVWGLRLEGRVDRTEERQRAFESISTQYRLDDRNAEAASFAELRSSLRRIEDILLRGNQPQQARQ